MPTDTIQPRPVKSKPHGLQSIQVIPHIQASGMQVSGQLFDEDEVPAGVGDEDLGHGFGFPNDEIIQLKTAGSLTCDFSHSDGS